MMLQRFRKQKPYNHHEVGMAQWRKRMRATAHYGQPAPKKIETNPTVWIIQIMQAVAIILLGMSALMR